MIRKLTALLVVIAMAIVVSAKEKQGQSVGLVLSGGGAKGIAHVGVIQVLEENNIPIDYVAGTSMGAIVGGLYASGYSPAEIMQLLKSPDFASWSTGQIDEKSTYYFAKSEPTPVMAKFSLGEKDSVKSNSILPQGLINPLPMNFAFMQLFSAYTAQCGGDFDRLYVPFRCVASDVTNKRKIVCRDGSLGDAIRASMTFPVVFYPIEMNGVYVYDGGIYDNFPVDVMKADFAPSIIIGVDVSTHESAPKNNNVLSQLEEMIMQGKERPVTKEEGIYIHVDLRQYELLDFPKAQEIYEVGYNRATEMIDTIKKRVEKRIPMQTRELNRKVFKSKTPHLRFDSVTVSGGTPSQNDYIKYLFTKNNEDTFDVNRARDAYYQIISTGKLNNLLPSAVYDESDDVFSLDLKAAVKDRYRVGFGGYVSSSTNSMLFFSGGYSTLSYNSFDAGINAWIGQSYMAGEISAKMSMRSEIPSFLEIQAIASRHKFYESENLFYEDNMPTFITNTELFARLNYCMAAGRSGKFTAGLGYGYLIDRFFQSNVLDFSGVERDKCSYNLGQISLDYEYNTLNSSSFPTQGAFYGVSAAGLCGTYDYNPDEASLPSVTDNVVWGQLKVQAENYFPVGKHFVVGTELNALASTRKLMDNYNASIVQAPVYAPVISCYNAFNPAFRANSYVAAGFKPIFKISDNLQLRSQFHCFLPMRRIYENPIDYTPYYGKWFSDPEFIGEVSAVLTLPFASLSAYANYMSFPSDNWNFGFSLGHFFIAPKFIR